VILSGDNRTIRLASHSKSWTAEVEPEAAAFQVGDVIPGSVAATYQGTKIHALSAERTPKDASRLAGSFSRDDLRTLFAGLPEGSRSVELVLTGDLAKGGSFRAAAQVEVEKGASFLAYGKAIPNPFNPSTTISFDLGKPWPVRLRAYDVTGRLVKTVANGV